MEYEIEPKLGGSDQVGLRLKCESQSEAEKIHLAIRQQGWKISRLMQSNHSSFTHFVYIKATNDTESELRSDLVKIEVLFNRSDTEATAKIVEPRSRDTLNFKSWQNLFRTAVKKLDNDSPRSTMLAQELDRTRLSEEIARGRAGEVEDKLLQQANFNDSNALRMLISLYAETDRHQQIVELYKAKRSEILALPVSGRLVEQLILAHLKHSQETEEHSELGKGAESWQAVQQIAREFLPELERLHQANGARKLLHQALNPQEVPPPAIGVTITEQLARLLEIEPGERVSQLESLRQQYPKATAVLLALAESRAAIGNIEEALQLYRSIPEPTAEIQQIYLSLLIESDRPQEVLELLPDAIEELSPVLSGLRGAALTRVGQKAIARDFLKKAWDEGQRGVQVLLPLARLWAEEGDPIQAGSVYQILQETAENQLTSEDYALMARVANLGGFGDLSEEQKVDYYEQCVNRVGSDWLNLPISEEILKDRVELWKGLNNVEGLLNAYADWLDWLANAEQIGNLEQEMAEIRSFAARQRITCQQHFELLEGIEPFVDTLPKLRQGLANDYLGIALKEIDTSIRQARSEAPFFQDLQRALLNLHRELAREVAEYRQQKLTEALELEIQIPSEEVLLKEAPNLSSLNLALVGGHSSTRREVIRELQERYCLKDVVEIAPSDEAYLNRSNVLTKLANCDLIAMITGYMGHDLSQIVSDLKKDSALRGEVLPLSCRGKSGVVREILIWWGQQGQHSRSHV